jgi:hypothetical protein
LRASVSDVSSCLRCSMLAFAMNSSIEQIRQKTVPAVR